MIKAVQRHFSVEWRILAEITAGHQTRPAQAGITMDVDQTVVYFFVDEFQNFQNVLFVGDLEIGDWKTPVNCRFFQPTRLFIQDFMVRWKLSGNG